LVRPPDDAPSPLPAAIVVAFAVDDHLPACILRILEIVPAEDPVGIHEPEADGVG